jgi:hypothetical protein
VSVSGKAYSVTPVIYVPTTSTSASKTFYFNKHYSCDPVPAASMNKGNFKFQCKSLRGKDVTNGDHTISWVLPTAASISIRPYTFAAMKPKFTPKYVVNTALAKTTLIPETWTYVSTTKTSTFTEFPTSTVKIYTGTTTCFTTVTVTPPASNSRVRRGLKADPEADSVAVDTDTDLDLDLDNGNPKNSTDTDPPLDVQLEERAATVTPTIAKPDYTYPPYGETTVYVKSISTTTYTAQYFSGVYETAPVVTRTTSCMSYTMSTVTVTRSRA